MPFLNDIVQYINEYLKKDTLNKEKLQPLNSYGLATVVGRTTGKGKDLSKMELLPAIITYGSIEFIFPQEKFALQMYHKLNSNAYSMDKTKSFGDANNVKCISDLTMVFITNSKITGKAKEVIEPQILFGFPQRLTQPMIMDLGISSCNITCISSNMDPMQVFKQEYPQSPYFLTEQISMFSMRYKIEISFSQRCIDKCLCD